MTVSGQLVNEFEVSGMKSGERNEVFRGTAWSLMKN
jgi:hypothetical protein